MEAIEGRTDEAASRFADVLVRWQMFNLERDEALVVITALQLLGPERIPVEAIDRARGFAERTGMHPLLAQDASAVTPPEAQSRRESRATPGSCRARSADHHLVIMRVSLFDFRHGLEILERRPAWRELHETSAAIDGSRGTRTSKPGPLGPSSAPQESGQPPKLSPPQERSPS